MNTKLHAITDAEGRPIRFYMTAGQVSDYTGAAALLGSLPNAILKFFRQTVPNQWKSFRSQVSDNFRVITHDEFRVLG